MVNVNVKRASKEVNALNVLYQIIMVFSASLVSAIALVLSARIATKMAIASVRLMPLEQNAQNVTVSKNFQASNASIKGRNSAFLHLTLVFFLIFLNGMAKN